MNNDQAEKFLSIELEILRINKLKKFDIYLRVGQAAQRYVLYSKKGTHFTNSIKEDLLDNKIKYVYVNEQDRDLYQEYIEDNLHDIILDPNINSKKKSSVVYQSGVYAMKKLFEKPGAELFSRSKNVINNVVNLILSDQNAISNLMLLTGHDYYTYTHSINVGVFGIGLAKELFTDSAQHNFHELGLGFFLHDIGKAQIPIHIINKPGPLDDEEWEIMRKHPLVGYEMLEERGNISKESEIIVSQHHERVNGKGYPRGISGDKIHVYAKICAIADTFDALTTRRVYQAPRTAFEALNLIKNKMLAEFDKEIFSKFVCLFSKKNFQAT